MVGVCSGRDLIFKSKADDGCLSYRRKIDGPSASGLAHAVCGPPKVLGLSDAKQFHAVLGARGIRRLLVSNMIA